MCINTFKLSITDGTCDDGCPYDYVVRPKIDLYTKKQMQFSLDSSIEVKGLATQSGILYDMTLQTNVDEQDPFTLDTSFKARDVSVPGNSSYSVDGNCATSKL